MVRSRGRGRVVAARGVGIGVGLALALGGCGGTPKPAEEPDSAGEAPATEDVAPASGEGATEPAQAEAPGLKSATGPAGGATDEYAITPADCQALGAQFATATRATERERLAPSLAGKARAQAEQKIEDAALQAGETWRATCDKTLAGKNGDPKAIKCASAAKTVKEFDACLNGGGAAK